MTLQACKFYQVTYASAGCMPEGDVETFDSFDSMLDSVRESYQDAFDMATDESVLYGADAPVQRDDSDILADILAGALQDPMPRSLYAWHIREVDASDIFGQVADATGGIDSCDGSSAYAADSSVDSYATGAHSRYSWHLQAPDAESDAWQVLQVRERYLPCGAESFPDESDAAACAATLAHESGCCSCTEPDSVDTARVDLLDLLQDGRGFFLASWPSW